jgi:hypothetical protein
MPNTDPSRIGGTIEFDLNGNPIMIASDAITYNLGKPLRETMVGPDKVHGYSEKPQPPFAEGEWRLLRGTSLSGIVTTTQANIHMILANGTEISFANCHFEAEGNANTTTASVTGKFVGDSAEEIPAS